MELRGPDDHTFFSSPKLNLFLRGFFKTFSGKGLGLSGVCTKTAYSRYKGCTYRERGAAPAHGAGINEASLYTVAPFKQEIEC